MIYKWFYICVFAITSFSGAVKVNMHGSLNLGKEVMDTISHYLRTGYIPAMTRRSLGANLDPIALEVETASLCANLEICKGGLDKFVNDYVKALVQTVESIFDGILNEKGDKNLAVVFFGKLKPLFNDVRKFLKAANDKITEEREAYLWVEVIKKISAKCQSKSISYVENKVEADPQDLQEIQKKLTQSIVMNIATAEVRAQMRLCHEFHICLKSNECSTALNVMLGRFKKLPKDKVKSFMKAFYEVLPKSSFYDNLNQETVSEFKVILKDMAHTDNVPTKEILNSVQEVVETRLNTMYTANEDKGGHDIQLVYITLSDLDFLYIKQKADPFADVLDRFLKWTKVGGKIATTLKDVIRNISAVMQTSRADIVLKLTNEVKCFLELTVDP